MYRFWRYLTKPANLFPKSSYNTGHQMLYSVWLLIVFTIFNGAIRKWVIGSGSIGNAIFFIQLLLPFIFYSLVLHNFLPKKSGPSKIFIVYVFYLIVAAANPLNHTIFHGLLGLLLHLGYWLIWLAYLQKYQWMELEKFVPLLILILLIEFFLGAAQYSLPGTHFLNQFASGEANEASVGDAIRASGTFSYIGGFQVMVPFYACLGWFMLIRKYSQTLIILVFGLGLLMALMSGSRSSVGFFVIIMLSAFLFTGSFHSKLIVLLVRGTLIISLAFILLPGVRDLAFRSFDNFEHRATNSDNVEERISGGLTDVINFRGNYPIFGVGLGATYQGANALFGESSYVKEYGWYESELARIVLEGGFVLFFLRLILLIIFLIYTKNLPRLVKFLFFIIYLNSMVTFNIYGGVFYVLGIILLDRGYFLKKTNLQQMKLKLLNKT